MLKIIIYENNEKSLWKRDSLFGFKIPKTGEFFTQQNQFIYVCKILTNLKLECSYTSKDAWKPKYPQSKNIGN